MELCVWGAVGWGGVGFVVTVCLSLSYPFQGGHLFPEGVGVTQLVSEFLSETIAPCCIFDVSIR